MQLHVKLLNNFFYIIKKTSLHCISKIHYIILVTLPPISGNKNILIDSVRSPIKIMLNKFGINFNCPDLWLYYEVFWVQNSTTKITEFYIRCRICYPSEIFPTASIDWTPRVHLSMRARISLHNLLNAFSYLRTSSIYLRPK